MVGVSPAGEWLVVGTEDYFVPGLLQPQAQPAGAAEEVGGQVLALSPHSLAVLKERLDVVSVVTVRWEIDEGTSNQPHTVTTALVWFLGLRRHCSTITGESDSCVVGRAGSSAPTRHWGSDNFLREPATPRIHILHLSHAGSWVEPIRMEARLSRSDSLADLVATLPLARS